MMKEIKEKSRQKIGDKTFISVDQVNAPISQDGLPLVKIIIPDKAIEDRKKVYKVSTDEEAIKHIMNEHRKRWGVPQVAVNP
jgi:hypothetical protein